MHFVLSAVVILTAGFQTVQTQTTPRGETARWFNGHQCLIDCMRHRAGYEWAQATGVNTYENCRQFDGKSFLLGCQTYVDAPYRDPGFDDDGKRIRRR